MTYSGNQPGKQAVVYCRVSSVKQTTVGDGLRSQETRCREFARLKGYTVTQVFEDDVSGKLVDRPGMKAMLGYLRRQRGHGGVVVIIDDVSRLARGLQAHLELRGAIAKAGGVLESPSIEFGEDSDSILVENLLASVSQHQRQKNGEQTMNRMKARLMNGHWPFRAPLGYRQQRGGGQGKMLRLDEPVASVIRDALEGYAVGLYETQADVLRFLQNNPLFPKDRAGLVRPSLVSNLMRRVVYAGYVCAPEWGISPRPGVHEGLISYETFRRIQDRLDGNTRLPKRTNLNEDFPLRGFVLCECGSPLTAAWSKGRNGLHAYYACQQKTCVSYRKSIRRDRIEGELEEVLRSLQPSAKLLSIAEAMLKKLWDRQVAAQASEAKNLQLQLTKVEGQIAQFLDRIVNASVPAVIAAYEARVGQLEQERMVLAERIASTGQTRSYDATVRTALRFVASPWKLWNTGRLEDRRTVLRLTFARQLRYVRNGGYRTAELSLPFKLLSGAESGKSKMVPRSGIEPPTLRFSVACSTN